MAALLLIASAAALIAAAPASKRTEEGGKIFDRSCVACHKADGSGGLRLVPKGNPSPDLRKPAFWAERTDSSMRETLRKGVSKSAMPAFKGVLKPAQIDAVILYMRERFAPKDKDCK